MAKALQRNFSYVMSGVTQHVINGSKRIGTVEKIDIPVCALLTQPKKLFGPSPEKSASDAR